MAVNERSNLALRIGLIGGALVLLPSWLLATGSLHAQAKPAVTDAPAPARAARGWDYLRVVRARGYDAGADQHHAGSTRLGDWTITGLGSRAVNIADIDTALAELGTQGWELVTVYPIASKQGTDTSGLTTEQVWVFKRPRE